MSICNYMYVLDFGSLIFEGTAAEVAASPDRAGGLSRLHRRDVHRGAGGNTVSATCHRIQRPRPTSRAALEVDGLTTGYGRTVVVRDVSLSVPGRWHHRPARAERRRQDDAAAGGVRIPPGSRKGKVRLFGEDVTKVAPHRRFASGLCHVPEGRGIFRSLTVRENLGCRSDRATTPRRSSSPRRRSRS